MDQRLPKPVQVGQVGMDWRTPATAPRSRTPSGLTPTSALRASDFTGSRVGDYEILERLAAGGMAEIFLARIQKHLGFEKLVVIKRILPSLARNNEVIEMFLDEARIAATLDHPNIVQTHDAGISQGNFYIAMEYLHGKDVRAIMSALQARQRRLPLPLALSIIAGAAAGLHYAHLKCGFDGRPLQIVHRDVSPQNIIVTYEGGIKLLDFGIAKASNRLRETQAGMLKGKIPYMSPEQCRSDKLDARSDVYSLGVMLWELTLSRRLYNHTSNDFEVLKAISCGRVPRPTEVDPRYPPALEAIVMRALEKEESRRWQTAREMETALEAFVRSARLESTPSALREFMEQLFGPQTDAWRGPPSAPSVDLSFEDDEQTTVEPPPIYAQRRSWPRVAFALATAALLAWCAQIYTQPEPPATPAPPMLATTTTVARPAPAANAARRRTKATPPKTTIARQATDPTRAPAEATRPAPAVVTPAAEEEAAAPAVVAPPAEDATPPALAARPVEELTPPPSAAALAAVEPERPRANPTTRLIAEAMAASSSPDEERVPPPTHRHHSHRKMPAAAMATSEVTRPEIDPAAATPAPRPAAPHVVDSEHDAAGTNGTGVAAAASPTHVE